MSILYIIHNIYPAGQADNLQHRKKIIDTTFVTSRHVTNTRTNNIGEPVHTYTRATYHDQRRKIYPRPEGLRVLNIIHYIYPSLQADHLPTQNTLGTYRHQASYLVFVSAKVSRLVSALASVSTVATGFYSSRCLSVNPPKKFGDWKCLQICCRTERKSITLATGFYAKDTVINLSPAL